MLAVLVSIVISCNGGQAIDNKLNHAQDVMNQYPDSALTILSGIDKELLRSKQEQARYALLMSMALDKNYIDTTTFDVLQPAIDYYLDKGSADERLRTLYYQGCIFLNKSDFDKAMDCYLKAEDVKNDWQDTLTYANLLVAQGNIYAKSYQLKDYIHNNIRASKLYNKIGEQRRELSSLIRALDGSISLGDKGKSDSIMTRTDSLVQILPELNKALARIRMTYGIRFDSDSVINNILDSISDFTQYDDETKLDISLGYLKLNEPHKAKLVFESIDPNSAKAKAFRYISIRPEVLEANGEYEKALEAYKNFQTAVESENSKIYSQKTTVAAELHELKLNHLYSIQSKDRQLWLGLCVVLVLIITVGIIYYQLRIGKKNRIISEKEQSRLQLENDNLQKQNTVLELEKQAKEIESEKQNLVVENMRLRISQLETENEQLKDLSQQEELPSDVRKVIKERIEKMNALFAARILEKDADVTLYDDWVKQEISDKEHFMDSNRLAFTASHPMFIKYLKDHELTDYEINYLCLYAIGLKGKEVGNYMQLRRHYNISSEIRRKLGIDEHDTNIGIYVRKLLKKL